MQISRGDFYYVSKFNAFNFTIYDVKAHQAMCYVWDESEANWGANELGSCVFKYVTKIATERPGANVIFWSDNCCGQQKHQFMVGLYVHALRSLKLNSITHKFLIKGHTQNEGDSVYSLIERSVKKIVHGGPLCTMEAFITTINGAKKTGEPYGVFYNRKRLPKI